ncbi:putative tyrosine aminotransferase [Trypanosoma rangeli]|uniref:Putative tyrosine aminotransferase n=1 Tax=Trypanosoma rangeli TaxID=5698 RepID=A0A3S5IQG1_TRYRA|nr:putative tyrosine aminotransferase [Trypanosoma rangeli]RNE99968.1 putative tyrosine aminotransferase [Trypanosoma rangeli]|eukprot:RNE99968.1 putative tyrosine aminotransferase [Trypanosoma rangeli]
MFGELKLSNRAQRCFGSLNYFVHDLEAASGACLSGKSLITFMFEDAALDGIFLPPSSLVSSVVKCAKSNLCNGYSYCFGFDETREAIGKYWKMNFAHSIKVQITGDHVVVASGSSDALSMCFGSLCSYGDNILLPFPSSQHYTTSCFYYGIEPRFYCCNHEKDCEIDFDHLRSLVDGKTKAILVNNPSNPSGSNFSRQHIAELIRVCEELRLPLISDEVYAGLVFSGEAFTSVAAFDTHVPRFVVSGLSMRFNVPGYRFGWVIVLDRDGYGAKLQAAVRCLATRSLMPNSVLQHAVVKALEETPQSYFDDCARRLEEGAMALYNGLCGHPGLKPVRPRGSLFIFIVLVFGELDSSIQSDVEFAKKLAEEENVHVLPGEYFNMPGALRITVSRPLPIIKDAVGRIGSFCERHRRG